ncbi:MAG: LacI family DNA-binding transcriptional regulator [Planctomycetota bacterium]|jgi:LacI family transcriptional regulator|nr:LacI family DNA-binding transcriptional regulator [Planctomycetota bacterium]
MKRVTLREVAAATGLSVATVSHILGGSRGDKFRQETRDLVATAAARLGYRASTAARSMRSGRTSSVALLLSTVQHRSQMPQELLVQLERGLAHSGHQLLVSTISESDEADMPQVLAHWAADAFLVNYNSQVPDQVLEAIDAHRAPTVWLNCKRATDCVHPDDLSHGRIATEHLLTRGHRTIAYLDCAHDLATHPALHHFSRHDRLAGYRAAMDAAGLTPIIHHGPEFNETITCMRWMHEVLAASDRAPGFVCYGGATCVRLATAALVLGLLPGRDIHLATIDSAPITTPGVPISTVVLDHAGLARAALAMLTSKLGDAAWQLDAQAICGHLVPG